MQRRNFLRSLASSAGLASVPLTFAGCQRPPLREAVLSALVRDVVRPDVIAVDSDSEALHVALQKFTQQPTPATLRAARAAWLVASLSWKRAACFKNGPLVDTNALVRATFWPTRPAPLEALVAGSETIDGKQVDKLGVDVKGVYALEYLLFPLGGDEDTTLRLFAPAAESRRGRLVDALGSDLAAHASRAKQLLGDGEEFAEKFAHGGQGSLSQLINQLIACVETVATNRLDLVLSLAKSQMLKPRDVEGWPSGASLELARAELSTVARLYTGAGSGGMGDLVRSVAPAIDKQIRERLRAVNALMAKLGAPLERLVQTEQAQLLQARDAVKDLEASLKVDVASALGVTLTFQMGDGD